MFEKASRLKLRFDTEKGHLSVEDLWDIPLIHLNKLAKILNRQIKDSDEEDFLKESSAADVEIKLGFDIVLYVLNTKKAEGEARKNAAANKARKEKLLDILAKKQDGALEDLSEKDLKKMIDELS